MQRNKQYLPQTTDTVVLTMRKASAAGFERAVMLYAHRTAVAHAQALYLLARDKALESPVAVMHIPVDNKHAL